MNMGNTYTSNANNMIDPNQYIHADIPNFDEQHINPQMGESTNQTNISQNINISSQPMIQRQDITGAVAVIRNTIINLQNNGYLIITNEEAFENSHQIIIEIRK